MINKNALLSVAALMIMGLTFTACDKEDNPVTVADNQYTATVDGKSEKPTSTTSTAIGAFDSRLNETTRTLSYTLTYSGMTPTAGHLHRISRPDNTGDPEITFPTLTSPIIGSTTLTQAKMDSLKAGFFYANLHSAAYKDGEIRGDIKK